MMGAGQGSASSTLEKLTQQSCGHTLVMKKSMCYSIILTCILHALGIVLAKMNAATNNRVYFHFSTSAFTRYKYH